jgi:hypothetical protein
MGCRFHCHQTRLTERYSLHALTLQGPVHDKYPECEIYCLVNL